MTPERIVTTYVHEGWTVEVADMDAMRIDRLIVTAPATAG